MFVAYTEFPDGEAHNEVFQWEISLTTPAEMTKSE